MDDKDKKPLEPKTPEGTKEEGKKGGDETPKTYTQEDLDRIAGQTREEEKRKAEKFAKDAVDKALEEERRLAKLSEEEKEKERAAKQAEELAVQKKEITIRENRADAKEKFVELGLPVTLVEFVVTEDKTEMENKINTLKKSYDEAVSEGVRKLHSGQAPQDPKTPINPNDNKLKEKKPITSF